MLAELETINYQIIIYPLGRMKILIILFVVVSLNLDRLSAPSINLNSLPM